MQPVWQQASPHAKSHSLTAIVCSSTYMAVVEEGKRVPKDKCVSTAVTGMISSH